MTLTPLRPTHFAPSRRAWLTSAVKTAATATLSPALTPVMAPALTSTLALACSPALALSRRDTAPLTLASEAPPDLDPQGWLVSEKLDGARAWWDGSRLRFRSGLPIFAPAWFTAGLPGHSLDGELWLGRGRFEELSGIVRRQQPVDTDWRLVKLMVFELPGAPGSFARRAAQIQQAASQLPIDSPWQAVAQFEVPSRAALKARLESVVRAGGEGLMLHRADAVYETGRSTALLKLKPVQDAEAVVVAHQAGQGRHAGRLGALKVRMADGRSFCWAPASAMSSAAALLAWARSSRSPTRARRHRAFRALRASCVCVRCEPVLAVRAPQTQSPPGASARRAPG